MTPCINLCILFVTPLYISFFLLFTLLLSTFFFFFFNDTATPEISPFPLPDALPICSGTHTYPKAGFYTFRVTAPDSSNQPGTATQTVTTTAAGATPIDFSLSATPPNQTGKKNQ